MRIIIIYASAGAGHYKAAEAVYNYFRKRNPSLDIKLIDALNYSSSLFKNSYARVYTFIINYIPWFWALLFYITYIKLSRKFINQIRFIVNRLNTKRLVDFLLNENPDFVISTHFLPSQVTAYLKNTKKINSQLISVITDFSVHPFWLSEGTDTYIVASDFTKDELIKEGMNEENIKTFGIPIDQKFSVKLDRASLCEKLSLNKDKFTVLIITGSFGIGPIEKIVDLLYQDVQVMAVCARNRRLLNRLRNKNYPNVKIFGFIDNTEELMSVSDIIITKPGGLTISELLSEDLIPVFISVIPGQETGNVRVLRKYGIGLTLKKVSDIKEIILDYKSHPDKLKIIKDRIKYIKKPYVLEELYNVVCKNSSGPCR